MSFIMKYEIEKDYLTVGSKRRSGTKMPEVGFMVGHDTGNPDSTAESNIGYYERSRNESYAAAHIFVDHKSIRECVPFLTGTPEKAMHVIYNVTTDNIMYGDDANDIAGGFELCWGDNIDAEEAYKRYVWVIAYALYKFNLNPAKHFVGHEILDPRRKIDPSNGLKHMGKTYAQLCKDIIAEYNECTQTARPAKLPSAITGSTYKVASGETLWAIAQRMTGVSVQDLIEWNPTIDAAKLKVGQVLVIKKEATKPVTKPTPKPEATLSTKPVAKPTLKPAPKPVVKPKFDLENVTLKRGDNGRNVLKMQRALCAAYFYPERNKDDLGCDSSFGPSTENAVERFQAVYCKTIDGIFGPATREAVEKLLNK